MFNAQDEDDDDYQTPFNDGHWEWSDIENKLIFISHQTVQADDFESLALAVFKHGAVKFNDDLDLLEQQRFRKRYQRKSKGEDDVILLQDIKDLVLYTAPTDILNINIIKILHLKATERFIRALILYCQYFLQISDTMSNRLIESDSKIRTKKSEEIEMEFRENLEDIRLLLANEYCSFLLEFEVHRIFKSQCFNIVEHRQDTDLILKMTQREKLVLLGHCVQHKKKLHAQSPLYHEIACRRPIDFRLIGLGYVKFDRLTSRQLYLEQILTASETTFENAGVTLGIIGLSRTRFDTILMEIKGVASTASSSISARSFSRSSSMRKSTFSANGCYKLYDDIVLPDKTEKEWLPESFPTKSPIVRSCNYNQRDKWLARQAQHLMKRACSTRKR